MSFPFGSGMPHNSHGNHQPYPNHNQAPFGNGFPSQPAPGGYPGAFPPSAQQQHAPYGGHSSATYPKFGSGLHQQPNAPQPGFHAPTRAGAAPYPNFPVSTGYPSAHGGAGHQQYQPAQAAPYPRTSAPYPGHQAPYPGHHQQRPASNIAGMANCFNEMRHNPLNNHAQHSGPAFPAQKGNPTVTPYPGFNSVDDCKALRKAMKGFGTDENGLIAVLCHRSNDQIQQIQRDYKTQYGRDLVEDVKSETSGNFETVLVALLTPRLDYYVKELHNAMAGVGTDEDALVEILCSLNNREIHVIKTHYVRMYGKHLESEIMSDTSGHFKRLLVSLCSANRDESTHVDRERAQQDATALLRAGELRAGTDESVFNQVLCTRSYNHIGAVCDEYERLTGHSLIKAIENEFSGDIKDGLIAIVQCTSDKPKFFASRLHKSMAGLGTTDSQLIRVLVTRCEIDLMDIKEAFDVKYNKSLRSWIKGDTSGHYKHALYHLIGEAES